MRKINGFLLGTFVLLAAPFANAQNTIQIQEGNQTFSVEKMASAVIMASGFRAFELKAFIKTPEPGEVETNPGEETQSGDLQPVLIAEETTDPEDPGDDDPCVGLLPSQKVSLATVISEMNGEAPATIESVLQRLTCDDLPYINLTNILSGFPRRFATYNRFLSGIRKYKNELQTANGEVDLLMSAVRQKGRSVVGQMSVYFIENSLLPTEEPPAEQTEIESLPENGLGFLGTLFSKKPVVAVEQPEPAPADPITGFFIIDLDGERTKIPSNKKYFKKLLGLFNQTRGSFKIVDLEVVQ